MIKMYCSSKDGTKIYFGSDLDDEEEFKISIEHDFEELTALLSKNDLITLKKIVDKILGENK